MANKFDEISKDHCYDSEKIKQMIEGYTQFMRGIFNNPNLTVPEDIAEKFNISSEYRERSE